MVPVKIVWGNDGKRPGPRPDESVCGLPVVAPRAILDSINLPFDKRSSVNQGAGSASWEGHADGLVGSRCPVHRNTANG